MRTVERDGDRSVAFSNCASRVSLAAAVWHADIALNWIGASASELAGARRCKRRQLGALEFNLLCAR